MMGAFDGKGMVIKGLRFLGPKEALELMQNGALLVDLRTDDLVEMKAFHVPEEVLAEQGIDATTHTSKSVQDLGVHFTKSLALSPRSSSAMPTNPSSRYFTSNPWVLR